MTAAERAERQWHRIENGKPPVEALLAELVEQHDAAAAIVKRTEALIRPLARAWADQKVDGVNARQFTMPSLDQLRRELLK